MYGVVLNHVIRPSPGFFPICEQELAACGSGIGSYNVHALRGYHQTCNMRVMPFNFMHLFIADHQLIIPLGST